MKSWVFVVAGVPFFSSSFVYSSDSLDPRTALREKVISTSSRAKSAPEEDDLAENLVDRLRYKSLAEIERADLLKAELPEAPWSDSYWPIYQGSVANRYSDPDFPAASDWKENFEFLTANFGQGAMERLSPAEKYDLLVGDENFTLTKRMLDEGRRIYEREGKVEAWMGICHGWAPAAFMVPRPLNAVRAKAWAGEREILFYPSDIKALTSLLWANAQFPTRFIGGRCETRNPANNECLDNNPGTWHLAVVNQIGVARRSFIMDASRGYEVWNQPVESYEYRYFDVRTNRPVSTVAAAKVARADFLRDPYRRSRSTKATHIVGVTMDVTYVAETRPSQELTDSPSNDYKSTVHYVYDLELDEQGTIVGGEWHTPEHPDFLWTPEPASKAMSVGDLALNRLGESSVWTAEGVLPGAWRTAAFKASSVGQPLARVVEGLIARSRERL